MPVNPAMVGGVNPAEDAAAVTPSDTVGFTPASRALYVGTGGNLTVLMKNGETVTFTNVQNGALLPIRCTRVNLTNLTASNIVSIW